MCESTALALKDLTQFSLVPFFANLTITSLRCFTISGRDVSKKFVGECVEGRPSRETDGITGR
jgi:hypothetical protein